MRDAAPTDAGDCAAVYAPYVVDTAISFESVAPTPEEMAGRIVAAQERHAWLVADEEGTVLGYAYAGPWRARPAYRHSTEVSVYVDRKHRGHGVGRALYVALLTRLGELGFHLAVAGMTEPNPSSRALHEALGFTLVGTMREVGHKHGRWHDVTFLQRPLPLEEPQVSTG